MQLLTYAFAALLCSSVVTAFVVITDSPEAVNDEPVAETTVAPVAPPDVRSFTVESNIKYRYARTLISSRVANPAPVAQEVFFSAVLPETAFISGFKLIIGDGVYEAHVKEKEKAKEEYAQAVSQGRTAGHVGLSARDSNRVVVSVNVASMQKVTFNLTYEQLLIRKLSEYHHVINLDPGQIVDNLRVTVNIEETTEITSVHVPPLRVSNEILDDRNADNDHWVHIDRPSPNSAVIVWAPTAEQQRELARDGIKGHLEVEYDVSRSQSGDIMMVDGYFVHFFAPESLTPLTKHVVFVLDVSGSMFGRKIEQLKQAMSTILDDLREGDYFSIVIFSSRVHIWDSEISAVQQMQNMVDPDRRGEDVPHIPNGAVVAVNSDNIEKAKDFLDRLAASGSTNIYDALRTGLEAVRSGRSIMLNITDSSNENDIMSEATNVPEPMIVFLTDGQANQGGLTEPAQIVNNITGRNSKTDSIFCLALGSDADFNFLKKLSLRNAAFARKIYEAADTALQLRDFYKQVSSPLLAHVNFTYPAEQIDQQSMTQAAFRRLYAGSEIVVAGRLASADIPELSGEITGRAPAGSSKFIFNKHNDRPATPEPTEVSNSSTNALERLWAYLTVQQLLEKADANYDYDYCEDECEEGESPNKQRALQLALRYSFVTPLTSLVVVKPNDTTSSVQTEDAAQLPQPLPSQARVLNIRGQPGQAKHRVSGRGRGSIQKPAMGMYIKARTSADSNYRVLHHSLYMPGAIGVRAPVRFGGGGGGGYIRFASALGAPGAPASAAFPMSANTALGVPGAHGAPVSAARPISANADDDNLRAPGPVADVMHESHPSPVPAANLNDITWLNHALNDSHLTLPSGPDNSIEQLKLASANQTNVAYEACITPAPNTEPGHCRHLKYCVLTNFTNSLQDYIPYLCKIEGQYAGVCCPDSLQPVSSN